MKGVKNIEEEFPITAILEAVELPTYTWYYHQNQKVDYEEKYEAVIENIKEVIRENPGYGYPKIKRELDRSYPESAGFEVVRKLLSKTDLSMRKHARNGRRNGYRKAVTEAGEEVNLIKQMDNIEAFEVACTDFTELSYDSGRLQVKLIPIVGYRCKMIYGWALGRRGDTNLAMEALEEMTGTLKKLGMRPEGMIIHHDQDAVFTGSRWADHLLHELEMQVSYSANGAKENTVMESTIGHFKGEALHLFQEATSLEELEKLVENQVTYWNQERMHSSIGYQTPEEFVENSSR